MKTCLICNHQEPGSNKPNLDVDYICSNCLLELTEATQEENNEKYKKSIKQGNTNKAYALYTFVSLEIRKKYPLNWRRNHAGTK